ncbi:PDDEXK nuclease domain-containing protein [Portibacter lacus]|uniref:PDDEXK nuclease domain-containing protein n=1 Tax=Portibacter lacus TaxID=1099794 RepID=UPI001F3CAAC9|nr:PDDEXK nuclease domain-containing protein [Portibacter lacus]
MDELINLVENTKSYVVSYANSSLTILFWKIGNKVLNSTLQNSRAEYGKQIVATVSRQLESKFGRNYEEKNLRRMIQFAQQFSDFEKVVTLSRQLSWSHFLSLIPIKSVDSRTFYAIQSIENGYSVRELRKQIAKKSFERSNNADLQLTKTSNQYKGIFKDPYLLDFLELKDGYLEYDLEKAILKELEHFILELGNGFSFIERQKRMIIDGEDFYLDLLFYHRRLKRLVAIELKIGKFKAQHKGQMELYLKWLDKYEKEEDEEPPIGLILCAEASKEQIELLQMHKDGIMVAEYWTELPPKKVLEDKLHQSLMEARERIKRKEIRNKTT